MSESLGRVDRQVARASMVVAAEGLQSERKLFILLKEKDVSFYKLSLLFGECNQLLLIPFDYFFELFVFIEEQGQLFFAPLNFLRLSFVYLDEHLDVGEFVLGNQVV